MAKHAITFRIRWNNSDSYNERYESFMEQVRKTPVWEETTSFALVTTNEGAEALCDRLYYYSKFNASIDTMVIIDISSGYAVSRGVIDDPARLRASVNLLLQK